MKVTPCTEDEKATNTLDRITQLNENIDSDFKEDNHVEEINVNDTNIEDEKATTQLNEDMGSEFCKEYDNVEQINLTKELDPDAEDKKETFIQLNEDIDSESGLNKEDNHDDEININEHDPDIDIENTTITQEMYKQLNEDIEGDSEVNEKEDKVNIHPEPEETNRHPNPETKIAEDDMIPAVELHNRIAMVDKELAIDQSMTVLPTNPL